MSDFIQDKGESLLINGNISLTILDIFGDEVVLAIDAPDWVEIGGCEPNRAENEWEDWISTRPR
jgi:sRNA-binding carbon storage regulator CsrA